MQILKYKIFKTTTNSLRVFFLGFPDCFCFHLRLCSQQTVIPEQDFVVVQEATYQIDLKPHGKNFFVSSELKYQRR